MFLNDFCFINIMNNSIKEMIDKDKQKVIVDTQNGAILVGTFRDNSSSNIGIIMFPGFSEHRSSLDDISEKLSNYFKVWNFDVNGQGDSTGTLLDIMEMHESVDYIAKNFKSYYGLKKMGGFGNSSGGMAIGITAAKDHSILECICLTTTPAGLQDIVKWYMRGLLKIIPKFLVRYGTIIYDKKVSKKNENYRNKSHVSFKTEHGYQPYAQIGAARIPNHHQMLNTIKNAPRLDAYAQDIHQPILFIYGGEDKLNGFKHSKIPKKIRNMYNNVIKVGKDILVVDNIDHGLNTKTKADDCLNQDPKYQFVKQRIIDFFCKYLL